MDWFDDLFLLEEGPAALGALLGACMQGGGASSLPGGVGSGLMLFSPPLSVGGHSILGVHPPSPHVILIFCDYQRYCALPLC